MSTSGYRGSDPGGVDGWSNYEKLVMSKLQSLEAGQIDMQEQIVLVRLDVATLKVKAGVWGGLAGLVPAAVGMALVILSGGST